MKDNTMDEVKVPDWYDMDSEMKSDITYYLAGSPFIFHRRIGFALKHGNINETTRLAAAFPELVKEALIGIRNGYKND
jgi:hypothetical protein